MHLSRRKKERRRNMSRAIEPNGSSSIQPGPLNMPANDGSAGATPWLAAKFAGAIVPPPPESSAKIREDIAAGEPPTRVQQERQKNGEWNGINSVSPDPVGADGEANLARTAPKTVPLLPPARDTLDPSSIQNPAAAQSPPMPGDRNIPSQLIQAMQQSMRDQLVAGLPALLRSADSGRGNADSTNAHAIVSQPGVISAQSGPALNDSLRIPQARTNAAGEALEIGILPSLPPKNGTPRPDLLLSTPVQRQVPAPIIEILTPEVKQQISNRAKEFIENSRLVPENVRDIMESTIAAEAQRRAAGARSPEGAMQRVENYLQEMTQAPQTLKLMAERSDRTRRYAVNDAIKDFVKNQKWPDPDKGPVYRALEKDLNGLSIDAAKEQLAALASNRDRVLTLSGRVGVSPPPGPETPRPPLFQNGGVDTPVPIERSDYVVTRDNIFDAGRSQPVRLTIGVPDSLPPYDPKAYAEQTDPLRPLRAVMKPIGQFGKTEQNFFTGIQQGAAAIVRDNVNSVTPPVIRSVSAGSQRVLEGTLDGANRLFTNAVGVPLQRLSNVPPLAVREAAVNITAAASGVGKIASDFWKNDIVTGTRVAFYHGVTATALSQVPTYQFVAGVVGKSPELQPYADLSFLAPGTYAMALHGTPAKGSVGEIWLGAYAKLGGAGASGLLDIRKGGNRLEVSTSGALAYVGTGFASPAGLGLTSHFGLNPETIRSTRFSMGMTTRVPIALPITAWNAPPVISSRSLPYGQEGNQLGAGAASYYSFDAPGTVITSYAYLGPIGIGARSPSPSTLSQQVFTDTTTLRGGRATANNFVLGVTNPAYLSSNPNTLREIQAFRDSLPPWAAALHDAVAKVMVPPDLGWSARRF
jgi:hypothetical protein